MDTDTVHDTVASNEAHFINHLKVTMAWIVFALKFVIVWLSKFLRRDCFFHTANRGSLSYVF